jgi:CubicO group peptidase (beta-lactamase class C family)
MLTFRHLAAFAALVILGGPVEAAPSPATTARAGGSVLQAALEQARTASGAPAMAVALIRANSIAVAFGGQRRIDLPSRIEREDRFHIGSEAKSMLAVLIAQQVDMGRLRWDSTLEELLPDVTVTGKDVYRRVTIADLLRHRGGLVQLEQLSDLVAVPPLSGDVGSQRLQFATWALQQEPVALPNTRTLYSNAGYVIAAAILERVTGQRYEHVLRRQLLAPLGIKARFGWPALTHRNEEPWGHALIGDQLVPVDPRDPESQIPAWANPAGNLSLSIDEFARYVQWHLRAAEGLPSWLSPQSVAMLHTAFDNYAMGWAESGTGVTRFSFHAGGSDLFRAYMVIVPGLDLAAVVVANADDDAVAAVEVELANQVIAAAAQP